MPFLWERLQPVLGLPVTFDPLYLSLIDQYVANVTGQGMHIGELFLLHDFTVLILDAGVSIGVYLLRVYPLSRALYPIRPLHTVLDPHNYARYRGDIIGEADSPVSTTFFGEFWAALAQRYMGNPLVVFGIMNEVNIFSVHGYTR